MKVASRFAKVLILWATLWGLYFVAAGAAGIQEAVAGGAVSAAVSWAVLRARSTSEARFLPRPRWLLPFLKVPWTTLQECWLLLIALVRRVTGRFEGGSFIEYDLPPASQDESATRHAITTIGVCLTPNDYIISIDRERRVARIRILVGRDLSGADKAFLELE